MLRSAYTSHQQGYSKPVDYFRPLTVDVSVEYELPKEVAPPIGAAPLLIIHPSAYYQNRKTAAPPLSSILSPSHTRSNSSIANNNNNSSSNASSSSSYYLRSHNTPLEGSSAAAGVATPTAQIYSRSSTRTSSVSRSRSMSMAVGAERAEKQQGCGDPFCDECIKKSKVKGQNPTPFTISYYGNQQQQKMELDLTPTKAKATPGIKRLRMSQQQREREVQKLQNQILGIGELPLNLAVSQALPLVVDPSLYLGASLSYRQHQQPPQPPPLYATRGGGGNTGIFQMINNVYAQQGSGGSGRLIFKEGPKGSGSDSGVCSENESDVSPSNNSNNDHSRRNLFSSVGDNNVVNNGSGCYCCCCPNTSSGGSDSSSTLHTHTNKSNMRTRGGSRAASNNNNRNKSSTVHHQPNFSHQSPVVNLGSSPIVPMDADSPAGAPYRKWFVPPTSADFGRWFHV